MTLEDGAEVLDGRDVAIGAVEVDSERRCVDDSFACNVWHRT